MAEYNLFSLAVDSGRFHEIVFYSGNLLNNFYYRPRVYYSLGTAWGISKQYPLAREYFYKALAQKEFIPDLLEGLYMNIAISYILENKFKEAEDAFEKGLAELPRSTQVAAGLAKLYFLEKKPNEAFSLLESYTEKYPKDEHLDEVIQEVLRWNKIEKQK